MDTKSVVHTFVCGMCHTKHPLDSAVVVYAELLVFAYGVREGELLCTGCARRHGVL